MTVAVVKSKTFPAFTHFRKMFREIMAIRTSQMMTSRSLICLLENQNGGKLQKICFYFCCLTF
jgi:hypothetical protein